MTQRNLNDLTGPVLADPQRAEPIENLYTDAADEHVEHTLHAELANDEPPTAEESLAALKRMERSAPR